LKEFSNFLKNFVKKINDKNIEDIDIKNEYYKIKDKVTGEIGYENFKIYVNSLINN
jgi:hypothetical protein